MVIWAVRQFPLAYFRLTGDEYQEVSRVSWLVVWAPETYNQTSVWKLFALVANPCEGTCGGWQAQSTDSQHRHMIDLFLLDPRLAGATDGGVGGTFQPSTNRQC